MKPQDDVMEMPVEVSPGVFKPLGTCTVADVEGASALAGVRAAEMALLRDRALAELDRRAENGE